MPQFSKIMQDMVNLNYDELVAVSKKAIIDVLPACKAVDEENNGMFMLSSLILTSIAADGNLSDLEMKLLQDALGMSADGIQKFINMFDNKMYDLVDCFVDNMNSNVKASALILVTALCSVDEKISREETSFIRKLID